MYVCIYKIYNQQIDDHISKDYTEQGVKKNRQGNGSAQLYGGLLYNERRRKKHPTDLITSCLFHIAFS